MCNIGSAFKSLSDTPLKKLPLSVPPPPFPAKRQLTVTGNEGSEELFTVVNVSSVVIILLIVKTLLMCQMPSLHIA